MDPRPDVQSDRERDGPPNPSLGAGSGNARHAASRWGRKPASLDQALAEAYENSLLYGEHTWGSNGGVVGYHFGDDWKNLLAKGHYAQWLKTFEDKCGYIRKTDQIVSRKIDSRLGLLAAAVKAEGRRVVVYNPLPWTRAGLVEIPGR